MCAPVEPLSNWNKSQTVATFHYTPTPPPFISLLSWSLARLSYAWFGIFCIQPFHSFRTKGFITTCPILYRGKRGEGGIHNIYVESLLYNLLKGSAPHLAGTLKSKGRKGNPYKTRQNSIELKFVTISLFLVKGRKVLFALQLNSVSSSPLATPSSSQWVKSCVSILNLPQESCKWEFSAGCGQFQN